MPTPVYTFQPSNTGESEGIRPGVVTIVKPLGPDEAADDLFETGPMFRVRYEHGPVGFQDAYLSELVPIDGAPAPAWGPWWDAEDHETAGGVQFYIETGERQTRRESFEHSIYSQRALLAAEAITRRAAAEVNA